MKKISIIIMLTFLIGLFFFLNGSRHLIQEETTIAFKIEEKQIYKFENSSWLPFQIYGVNINAGAPGFFPGEDFVEKEEYLRWLKDIDSLGMNCVRLLDLMPENFYKALKTFNSTADNKIYVLQGINFNEVSLKNGIDPLTQSAIKDYRNKIETVINAVHGNPSSNTNIPFFDSYVIDVSEYVIGYCLGPDWQSHDVIYSNIMNDPQVYDGEYFYSSAEASAFESYITRMLDHLVAYESDNYSEQKLVSILGSISIHQTKYTETADGRVTLLEKESSVESKSYVDLEEIIPKITLKSGYFVSYNVYLEEVEQEEGSPFYSNIYEKIQDYHSMPVVITEYGYPSNRLATDYIVANQGFQSESQQAQRVLASLDKIEKAKCAGSFLMEWHDSWFKSTWNTKKHKILDSSPYWSDAQTSSQFFGVIGYEPRKDERIFYPDGSLEEWKAIDVISEQQGFKLSVASDEKYVYLMLSSDKENVLDESQVYFDIDVTDKSGVSFSSQFDLLFESPIDFVIEITNESGRVYVHEYYNTFRFEKSLKALKIRPDIVEVTKNMDQFSPIFIDIIPNANVHTYENIQQGSALETGKLYSGIANPLKISYVSYADYYYGRNFLEVRVPWGLMNFMDPSKKIVHNDYYEKYNIEPLVIREIKVGATLKKENSKDLRIISDIYSWEDWVNPSYEIRYKKVFQSLKERNIEKRIQK